MIMSVKMIILVLYVILFIHICVGITINFDKDPSITEISRNVFKNYENSLISAISIIRTPASRIDGDTFSGMDDLLSLDLQSNKIQSLDQDLFKNNRKLQDLSLASNQIEVLPLKIFSSLTSLEELDLKNNKIKYLPEGIFNSLKKLQTLKLSNNEINDIFENQFSNSPKLAKLFLHENYISKIHPNTFESNLQLEYISLSSNKLTKIKTGTFTNLEHLNSLDLSFNQISAIEDNSLPETISSYFLLNNNNLQYLSPEILLKGKDASYAYYCPNPLNCNSKMIDMFKIWKEHFASRSMGQNCICKQPKKLEGGLLADLNEKDFL